MSDVHNIETRSYNMSCIKGKNTKPEIIVRKYLHSKGFRYKLHDKTLPGKPDIVLPKFKTAIFINGCFWHGHENCKYFTIPKTKTEWWLSKINKNILNDKNVLTILNSLGWRSIEIWECELKVNNLEGTLAKLISTLTTIS